MDFNAFLKIIPKVVKEKLPAQDAHNKMAPPERIHLMKDFNLEKVNPRKAAVMMLFYPKNNQTHLVLIKRTSYNGVHSSQVAFPGGKHEDFDTDFSATALRETYEEIGIEPSSIDVIRAFTSVYIPPSNFMVYPFFAISNHELNFVLDAREVAGIIEFPLVDFLNDAILVNKIMDTSYSKSIAVPAFKIEDFHVWGATAMMLSELKDVLKSVI
jgi:8-oxo-dGTP pyrophosphatase MutT (NUDIX family)